VQVDLGKCSLTSYFLPVPHLVNSFIERPQAMFPDDMDRSDSTVQSAV